MYGISEGKKYLALFFVITFLLILSACDGITPTSPVIHSFTAIPSTITSGDSSTLSWSITDATSATINQGIGAVVISGSIPISPTSTTTYTLTAINSSGSTTATAMIIVNPPSIVEQSKTIQPGPVEGKDSSIWTYVNYANFVDRFELKIGGNNPDIHRAYLQFDLSALPSNAVIVSADLLLYQYEASGTGNLAINVHRVTSSWLENNISWLNQPQYLPSPENTMTVTTGIATWLSWDIASLLQGWLNGEIPNFGVVLKETSESKATISSCYSSDFMTDTAVRPKLEITYYVP